MKGSLTAERIDIGGRVRAHEISAKNEVSVGGSIATDVGVRASEVRIGRNGKVIGPIHAGEVLIRRGAHVEDVYGRKIVAEREARARDLYGETIHIESGCRVEGEVQYTASLETGRDVFFAKSPMKVEKLPS